MRETWCGVMVLEMLLLYLAHTSFISLLRASCTPESLCQLSRGREEEEEQEEKEEKEENEEEKKEKE